jgi:hypothetical protein
MRLQKIEKAPSHTRLRDLEPSELLRDDRPIARSGVTRHIVAAILGHFARLELPRPAVGWMPAKKAAVAENCLLHGPKSARYSR